MDLISCIFPALVFLLFGVLLYGWKRTDGKTQAAKSEIEAQLEALGHESAGSD